MKETDRKVPASNFVGTLAANVNNSGMDDKEFRAFVRKTLPIVIYDPGRFLDSYEKGELP